LGTAVSPVRERTWSALPPAAKLVAKAAWGGFARLTAHHRLLPSYLIIGTQRGGTTSLYKYLVQHPALGQALTKELRFFDLNYHKGLDWYRSRFPTARRIERRLMGRPNPVVGEASPDYLFHPHAPRRIAGDLPDVKLIVLLRNPVDRAYSHYWHQFSRGHETLSFADAVSAEPERLRGELLRMKDDESYVSYERHHHSYIARGKYAEQLEVWFQLFARDRFLIESSERFFQDPSAGLSRALNFLGVADRKISRFEVFNAFTAGQMEAELRIQLERHFRPHNEHLYDLLGEDFGWDE
jgi:hypothetical protein